MTGQQKTMLGSGNCKAITASLLRKRGFLTDECG